MRRSQWLSALPFFTRSSPTIRIASPGCNCVAVPWRYTLTSSACGVHRIPVCTGSAFQSALAKMSADVSNVCGDCPCAGTLCTCVPFGIVIAVVVGSLGEPGAACKLNERYTDDETPGVG